ncbi:MAG: MBL fold metallo-hydrolase [Bacillota bacterium]
MLVKVLPVGPLQCNCYVVKCEKTGEAMVIDPGASAPRILDALKEAGAACVRVVLTHAHADHIGAVREIRTRLSVPVYIHEADAGMLTDAARNLSLFSGMAVRPGAPDGLLKDEDAFSVGELSFQVYHTPGHTPGGICIYGHGVVFTGDTLFAGSIGRTDLPGGSYTTLIRSIKDKLMRLPADVVVYPGHGPESTVGDEKRYNPFVGGDD